MRMRSRWSLENQGLMHISNVMLLFIMTGKSWDSTR